MPIPNLKRCRYVTGGRRKERNNRKKSACIGIYYNIGLKIERCSAERGQVELFAHMNVDTKVLSKQIGRC